MSLAVSTELTEVFWLSIKLVEKCRRVRGLSTAQCYTTVFHYKLNLSSDQ